MIVKKHFDKIGVENFIPMQYIEEVKAERKYRKLVPAVHNLIFIRTTQSGMKEIKSDSKLPIRYMMNPETKMPVTIPNKQMQDFIAVSSNLNDQIVYLDSMASDFRCGEQVRITSGPLCGVEGMLVRICGNRRVVVNIQGVMAVATAFIHSSMLEKLLKN